MFTCKQSGIIAADSVVKLYIRLSRYLDGMYGANFIEISDEHAARLISKVRGLCCELERLLEAIDMAVGDGLPITNRIREITGEVDAIGRDIRALLQANQKSRDH